MSSLLSGFYACRFYKSLFTSCREGVFSETELSKGFSATRKVRRALKGAQGVVESPGPTDTPLEGVCAVAHTHPPVCENIYGQKSPGSPAWLCFLAAGA